MFEHIKKALETGNLNDLSSDEMYHAYIWVEEGRFDDIDISSECLSELSTFMCMNF